MKVRPLAIDGAWEFTPRQFGDDRGLFLEWFKSNAFREATGRDLDLRQANCSVSTAGTLRGIHYTQNPPGQAKYVTCVRGAVLDVIVDLRVGSPTFGQWDTVLLDDRDRRIAFLSEGLGHGFLALEDHATVIYLCDLEYTPELDGEVHPLDPAIGIEWPSVGTGGTPLEFTLSAKDTAAPTLEQARAAGKLPTYIP